MRAVSSGSRGILFACVLVIVAAIAASASYGLQGLPARTSSSALPSYCSKPPNGFLIVASSRGYNDSVDHGVPANPWPVLNVAKGSTVTITVCDIDQQAHGFQVQHYLASPIFAIAPGQSITRSFVADEGGEFQIYCSIPCTIHWSMQSGELVVS